MNTLNILEQEINFELTAEEENKIKPFRDNFLSAKERYDKKYILLVNLKSEISKIEQLIIAAENDVTTSKKEIKNILKNPASLSVKQIYNLKTKSSNSEALAESYREVKEAMEEGIGQLELDAHNEITKIAGPRDAYSLCFGNILLNRSKNALSKMPELEWLKMAICLIHTPLGSPSLLRQEYDERIQYKYNKTNIPRMNTYSNISKESTRNLISEELLSISNKEASLAVLKNNDSLLFNSTINEEMLPTFTPAQLHLIREKIKSKGA